MNDTTDPNKPSIPNKPSKPSVPYIMTDKGPMTPLHLLTEGEQDYILKINNYLKAGFKIINYEHAENPEMPNSNMYQLVKKEGSLSICVEIWPGDEQGRVDIIDGVEIMSNDILSEVLNKHHDRLGHNDPDRDSSRDAFNDYDAIP